MTRDINVVVSVSAEPDSATIEIKASGGDEGMRADVTELVLAHLGELWAKLGVANRIKAVELEAPDHQHDTTSSKRRER
ncbi:MAG TPA: hypothetical protein VN523_00915 [Hyphomicrobiaceae bacterium]|jgi:hypothetical protein|nr:hypothetical protein [Hyphomicrobiaceae bacterium]